MDTPKTPECCKTFMKLRAVYMDVEEDIWYSYQCINCGKVKDRCEEEDDEEDEE